MQEIFGKCRFIISASCSETLSSAVLTAMRYGLIPVVMTGTGMDNFSEYCYYFSNYEIESIERVLEQVCATPLYELTS